MPDFRTYVREHLPALNVSGAREAEIVEELALEFEESYELALLNGSTPEEAWQQVMQNSTPWHELAEQLRSELKERIPVEAPEPTHTNSFLCWIDDVRHDAHYAIRQSSKSPGFAVIAILTLALGIGANTAIFSLLNAVVFRTLPVRAPRELVFFGNALPEGGTPYLASGKAFSYPFYREFRERNQLFSDISAVQSVLFEPHGRVGGGSEMEKIGVELVSGTYFNTLGLNAAVGRLIGDDDDRTAGAHPVAVASYAWWQRRLAANPATLGEPVTINSTVYTLIGVAPPGFFGVTVGRSPDLWIPLAMQKQISPAWNGLNDKRFQTLHLIARLKPGWTAQRAAGETTAIYRQIAVEHAAAGGDVDARELDAIRHQHIELTSAATGRSRLRLQFSSPLAILMVVVALVLLIACANIANILLARALVRQREIAIRISLGAARGRLIRQLLLESGLVAASGAVIGVFVAWAAGRLLLAMVSKGSQTVPLQIAPDAVVLSFTVAITVLTVILFGTVPAFFATRLDVAPSLKEGRATTSSPKRNRLARALAVAQVAFSLVLLIAAGLFLRSLNNLTGVDSGFDKNNVLVMGIDPAASGYKDDARLESMMQRVEERVGSLPGISGTSFVFSLFDGGSWSDSIQVPGRMESDSDPNVNHNVVGPQFFDALKMPIVLGRGLDERDTPASRKVAVINETMGRVYFNNSPLGKTFGNADDPDFQNLEVVGVVKDAKYEQLDEKQRPAAFYPHAQHIGGRFLYTFIARYSGGSAGLIPEIRRAIHEIDPNLTLGETTTLDQIVADSVVDKRLVARLSAFFGAVAAFLACIGIYGVMSFGVARRTNEMGIRMALGACGRQVLWVVLRETLQMAIMGTAIGVFLAIASGSFIQSELFGVSPTDPMTFVLAALAILTVALFAGYLPARRAMQINPAIAFKNE